MVIMPFDARTESETSPADAAAPAAAGSSRSAPGELAGRTRNVPPDPDLTEPQRRAAVLAHVRRPRDIPREFGSGSRVEDVWLRAASLRPGCPLVCVSSADGGVGRSTLVAALGGLLALACPQPVVAVDLTGRAWGGLEHRVARRSQATVWDACVRVLDLQSQLDVDPLVQLGPSGLQVLVGEQEMTSERHPPDLPAMHPVVGQLRAIYPLAVLDLPTANTGSTWSALGWAAAPVLVARATTDSVQHTLRLLAHLRANGVQAAAADVVVLVVMASSPSTAREVRAAELLAKAAVRDVIRVPYDPVLARPEPVDPRALSKATRTALTEVAAAVLQRCPADPDAARALLQTGTTQN